MSKLHFYLLAFIVLILGGCLTTTLHAPYSDETIVYDSTLVGLWSGPESGEILKFNKGQNRSYNLVYIDENDCLGHFEAVLFKINDQRFLDIYPADLVTDWSDAYKEHFQPLHSFMLIEQTEPNLKLALLDTDNLYKYIKEKSPEIKYEKINGDLILTSPTAELQKFIGQLCDSKELFADSALFERVKK